VISGLLTTSYIIEAAVPEAYLVNLKRVEFVKLEVNCIALGAEDPTLERNNTKV
jgi:hypothetical protein